MIDFDACLDNGRYNARILCYSLNLGWATLSRYLDKAEQIAQILAPGEKHFDWFEERTSAAPRQNVYLTALGGVALMASLPGRIPGKAEGLAYFLALLNDAAPPPPVEGASGFVVGLENRRGLIRFSITQSPIMPGTVLRPGSPSELRARACMWAVDAHQTLIALNWALSAQGKLVGSGGWFKLSPLDLLGLNQTAVMAVTQYYKRSA